MFGADLDIGRVERDIEDVLCGVVDRLPRQCSSLAIKRPRDINEGVSFELTPSSPKATKISVYFYPDIPIVLEAGLDCNIEFSYKGKWYTQLPFREELEVVCSSLVAGDFEETLWLVGEHIFKSRTKISIHKEWVTFNYRHSFHPLRRSTSRYIKYSPYWM